ncbi:MAG TPA: CHRD domain-containing protein [Gemmatimonadales bacterium]
MGRSRPRYLPGTIAILVSLAASAACSEQTGTPTELAIPVFSHGSDHAGGNFGTHMKGGNETPPRLSLAQGQLVLRLDSDGNLAYRLLVAGAVDITQAHIHLAPPGVPGPVIAWLYPAGPPARLVPGRFDGVLAEGVIGNAGVVGPLAGQGVAGLIEAIREGNAYANVHTVLYPPGEIRGQVK